MKSMEQSSADVLMNTSHANPSLLRTPVAPLNEGLLCASKQVHVSDFSRPTRRPAADR